MSDPRSVSAAKLALAVRQMRSSVEGLDLLGAEPIAVIGMGCRFPGGATSPDRLWRLLVDGFDAVREVPPERFDIDAYFSADTGDLGKTNTRQGGFLDDIDRFDAGFFGIAPREAGVMDPQQRMLLEVAWEALEDAGQVAERLSGSATGVFVAVYNHDYLRYQYGDPLRVEAYTSSGTAFAIAAGRLSFLYDLRGPAIVVDTACSSSLVAAHLASASLRARECNLAIVGGAGLVLGPETGISLTKWGMLSPDGRCKTFDARADGFGRSEGCGVIILKRLSDALADRDRVWAVLRGSAINQDGRSTALTAPNGLSQQDVVRQALDNGRVEPADVGYVEAHGTGTPLGDPIEVEALAAVLGGGSGAGRPCALSSIKANIGHAEAAAGVAGLIKATLVLAREAIPPHVHYQQLSPHISFEGTRFYVPTELRRWPRGQGPRFAGVSSFGFSGTNAHIVLEEAPQMPPAGAGASAASVAHLLPISAQNEESLRELTARYAERLMDAGAQGTLADVCYTAALRRTHHDYRVAVAGSDPAQIADRLASFARGEHVPGVARGARTRSREPRPVFVFSGQGPQWWAMGRELSEQEPTFRSALERCAEACRPHAAFDLLEELDAAEGDSRMAHTEVAQPAIFALQVALTELLKSWGITPAAVVGHSMGEVAAAHVAGILSLGDAARLIVHRGRLMQRATGLGRMASVELPDEELRPLVDERHGRVSIAALNAPRSSVVSGEPDEIKAILEQVQAAGVSWKMLPVDYAFHSAQMDPHRAEIEVLLSDLRPGVGALPMVSTVTGEPCDGRELSGDYWGRNMRDPVRFAPAIQRLLADGYTAFVEVAPHPVLSHALVQCGADVGLDVAALPTLRRSQPERATLLHALGGLFAAGATPEWGALFPQGGHVVSLPTYAWSKERFPVPRFDPRRTSVSPGAEAGHPLLGARLSTALPQAIFEAHLSESAPPFLAEHRLGGAAVLPAAAYLELGLAAARETLGEAGSVVEDMALEEMLVLPSEEQRTLQVIVERVDADASEFRVCSRGAVDDGWTTHARGTLRRAPTTNAVTFDAETLAALPSGSVLGELDGDAFYAAMQGVGPDFGPSFREIRHVAMAPNEALARVAATDAIAQGSERFGFHPAHLDACLQVAAAALGGFEDLRARGEVYLPLGLRKLRLLESPGAELIVRASARAVSDGDWLCDIRVAATDGRPVAELTGLRVRRVSRNAVLRAVQSVRREWLHEVTWPPVPAPASPADSTGVWAIVDDGQGRGANLQLAFEALGAPSVLIPSGTPLQIPDDCAGVVHLAALAATADANDGGGEVQAMVRRQCTDVVRLLEGLVRLQHPPRLALVTRGAQSLHGEPIGSALPQAAIWGLRSVIALEHPEVRVVGVDLDPDGHHDEMEALASELLSADGEDRVAYRGGARHAARLVRAAPTGRAEACVSLDITTRGVLDNLVLRPRQRRPPGAGEVEVRVQSTGLNFRDVLNALGMYPGDAGAFGDECAGVVVAKGPGVEHLEVGDEVMAFIPGAFTSYVTGSADMVVARPPGLSPEQASAVPVAYLTAAYALEKEADLQAGQRVLIHAAAGGVGSAAVQIALGRGAEVFATAGGPRKRRYLESLGVQHVMDSRSLDFASQVMTLTGGEGVDVVLNSLAGEFIPRSLSVLRAGGCFLEIGKTGIWTDAQVEALGRDIRYSVIYLGDAREQNPELLAALLRDVGERLADGRLSALPVRAFPLSQAAAAFRFMAQARHIGKVVLRHDELRAEVRVRPDATYLVTGGLGGLGLQAARSLAEQGARSLMLVGRSAPSPEARRTIDALAAEGVQVRIEEADVASTERMESIETSLRSLPPLRGIVHAAGALDDVVLADLDELRWDSVLAPKVAGTWNLHRLAEGRGLDFFICFSAGAALLGSLGQGNYAAANSFLDAFASDRHARGLAALSIHWGAWSEVGMAARLTDHDQKRWRSKGMDFIAPADGVRLFLDLLSWPRAEVSVLPARWDVYAAGVPDSARRFFTELVAESSPEASTARDAPSASNLIKSLESMPASRRRTRVLQHIHDLARRALGVGPGSEIAPDRPLRELGLDSLMAVELRNSVASSVGQPLQATLLFDYPTLDLLADYLLEQVLSAAGVGERPGKSTKARGASPPEREREQERRIAELSDAEAEAALLEELEATRADEP